MKISFFFLLGCLVLLTYKGYSQDATVTSPDKHLKLCVWVTDGKPTYSVTYKNKPMLERSPLGLTTNEGDFTSGMKLLGKTEEVVNKNYIQDRIKKAQIQYAANKLFCNFENAQQKKIAIVFQISNNDIAFRYELSTWGQRLAAVVQQEATGFKFPAVTTTFLSTMMDPTAGWSRTTPSYETPYVADAPTRKANPAKEGYIFPGLFKIGNNGWVLVSETGVSSLYCASQLSEISGDDLLHSIPKP